MRTIHLDRLRAASSQHDLLALVRDYLSEWRPEELAPFPIECRPGKLVDSQDLSDFALDLTRAYVAVNLSAQQQRAIEEMDAFVGQACQRMAELERRAQQAELTSHN